MIIIRLKGGMGNQMFQYAFAQSMAHKLNTSLKIDCTLLLDRARGTDYIYRDYDLTIFELDNEAFTISPQLLRALYKVKSAKWSRFLKGLVAKGYRSVKEKHFHVEEDLLRNPVNDAIYDGWWQSERYFEDIREDIKKAFSFKTPVLPTSASLLQQISNTNSVCLNVRRTDFLTNPALNTTNKDYFIRASHKIGELVDNPQFFIFSDDVAWCEANLKLDYPMVFVQHSHKGHKFGNYMQLMIACKHFIIPNSSFAWWAVWLNEYENKQVIAPKVWVNGVEHNTKDVVPVGWLRM